MSRLPNRVEWMERTRLREPRGVVRFAKSKRLPREVKSPIMKPATKDTGHGTNHEKEVQGNEGKWGTQRT